MSARHAHEPATNTSDAWMDSLCRWGPTATLNLCVSACKATQCHFIILAADRRGRQVSLQTNNTRS